MIELRHNDDGSLDELVATGADVHFEDMGDGWFFLVVQSGEHRVMLNVEVKQVRVGSDEDLMEF